MIPVTPPSKPMAEWAVLIYSSASADIEKEAAASLADVARLLPSDGVVVGAQLGRSDETLRYTMRAGASPQVSSAGHPDMSQAGSLEDFLKWGIQSFPARHVMLVLGGHGAGFLGAVTDTDRHHLMAPDQVAHALSDTSMHPDVLVYNARLMSQTEVAASLSSSASVLVAAQSEEHGVGLPLGKIVSRLPLAADARSAAAMAVQEASLTPEATPVVAALDLSRVDALLASLDRLGQGITAHPEMRESLRNHIRSLSGLREGNPWDRPLTDMKDVSQFAADLASDAATAPLKDRARSVQAAVGNVVFASESGPGHAFAHGLSAYLPSSALAPNDGPSGLAVEALYVRLMGEKAPHWVEGLRTLWPG